MKKTPFISALVQSKISWTMLLLFTCALMSCSDDDRTTEDPFAEITEDPFAEITEEQAAEAMLMAVSPETGGTVVQTQEALYVLEGDPMSHSTHASYQTGDYECGQIYNATYSGSDTSGSYTFDIDYQWDWTLYCDAQGNPEEFIFDLNGSGYYTTPRMTSDDTNEANIQVSGLNDTEDLYLINEEYTRTGTQESFIRNKNSFSSTITMSTVKLSILKSNYNITSGSMAIAFKGTSSQGNTYSFSGELVFHGNQTATLTLGSGNAYELVW
ncbi:hypothetical protein [Sinomicrobium sp. M5D2P17]